MISLRPAAYSSMTRRISSERVGLVVGACYPASIFRVQASCPNGRREPKGTIDLHQRDQTRQLMGWMAP